MTLSFRPSWRFFLRDPILFKTFAKGFLSFYTAMFKGNYMEIYAWEAIGFL